MERLTLPRRSAVIAHELAHLRRRDHWVRLLELLAMAVLWWHPLLWIARRGVREAEEQCCDAWVVSLLTPRSRRQYADALVEALELVSRAALPAGATGLGQMKTLQRRLTMILTATPSKSLSQAGRLVVVIALATFPLVPVRAADKQPPPAGAAPAPAAAPASAPADDATRKAVVALLEAAQDPNQQVQQAATDAIIRFGPKAAPVLVGSLSQRQAAPLAISLLARLQNDAIDPLLGAMRSQDAVVRHGALQAFEQMFPGVGTLTLDGEMGAGGYRGQLMVSGGGLAVSPSPWNSNDAARRVIDPAISLTRDSDVDVRQSAVRLLGRVGIYDAPRSAEALLAALKDENVQVRRLAAAALMPIAAQSGAPANVLAAAVRDADANVRLAAIQALGAMGAAAEPAMSEVTSALRDPDPNVRAAAAVTLGAMQTRLEQPQAGAGPEGGAPGPAIFDEFPARPSPAPAPGVPQIH